MVRFLNEFWSRDERGEIFINWELGYELVMQILHKLLLNLALAVSLLVLLYALFTGDTDIKPVTEMTIRNFSNSGNTLPGHNAMNFTTQFLGHKSDINTNVMHIWCILTKVDTHPSLKTKFEIFSESLIKLTTQTLTLHIISDEGGRHVVENTIDNIEESTGKFQKVHFYELAEFAEQLQPLVRAMQPHFSSAPGSYYSDALFFLSLGLHKVAPPWMSKCIMVDIDTQVKSDISLLWAQFDNFSSTTLVGLAPELSPVYRHALYSYRASKHGNTKVGEPYSEGGYSGLNSGVVLLNLERLRNSKIFSDLSQANAVSDLAKKYSFRGHLGDQDFYTLLGIERPELIHIIPCTWNRQLCTWWQDHGYADIFERFFACEGKINLYHGNCNSRIPDL